MFNKTSSNNLQIDSLDGIRGLALLFVLCAHTSFETPILGLDFKGIGKYGVYLFFILSAFLLSLPLFQKPLLDTGVWVHYFKRRFLRIYPLFFAAMLACFLFPAVYIPLTTEEILGMLLLLGSKGVFWSITVEFKFYFVLPLFILAFRILKNNLLYCSLASVILLAVLEYFWPHDSFGEGPISIIPYMPVFVFGMLTALFYAKLKEHTASGRYLLDGVSFLCFFAVLATIPALWGVEYTRFHFNYLYYAVLWSLMMISFLKGAGLIRRILASVPMRFLGLISFSAYLWHWFIITLMDAYMPLNEVNVILVFPAVLGLSYLSYLSYLVFERPFMVKQPAVSRVLSALTR